MATTFVACQAMWFHRMLKELMHEQVGPSNIMCDNKSSIALDKNSIFHRRTNHIDIKYLYICKLVKNSEIKLKFCKFEN